MTSTSRIVNEIVKQAKPERLSRFISSVRVKFIGGNGGDGCISMLHLFANEFAGPCGGNGGKGGHIVLRANHRIKSLGGLAKVYQGNHGERGFGKSKFGKDGEHKFVDVPLGTLVCKTFHKDLAEHEIDPDESEIVAELDQDGSMFIAARGGNGGRGNATYLSNRNRHPLVAERGAKGDRNIYEIRMKLYAHIALIGLPNVGKSTLLRTLTHANVKIGNYAFTTLNPQVGVLQFEDYKQVAISDLPGLIDESHKNRGLGLKFLRHAQRCACLAYLVDMTKNPVEQLRILFNELEQFKRGLSTRPHIVIGNMIDLPGSTDNIQELEEFLTSERPGARLIFVSSERGDNLEELRAEFKKLYDRYEASCRDGFSEGLIW